jgi:serine/threonine protein kinase
MDHPRIVEYFGSVDEKDSVVLFIEYMSSSVLQMIKKCGPLGEKLTLKFTRQTIEALAYIHSQGMVHNDVKCKFMYFLDDSKLESSPLSRKPSQWLYIRLRVGLWLGGGHLGGERGYRGVQNVPRSAWVKTDAASKTANATSVFNHALRGTFCTPCTLRCPPLLRFIIKFRLRFKKPNY